MAMVGNLTASEEAQLQQTIEMFEAITQSQPQDYQSLEILKEAYQKLGRDQDVINTSKRIAQACVMMGQLSSAILEYESILQRCPDDTEVRAALTELESKASSLNIQPATSEPLDATKHFTKATKAKSSDTKSAPAEIDDGRKMMQKIFVESKVIGQNDFDTCWGKPDLAAPAGKIVDPFIQVLADKSILPMEKSLKIISDKHRSGFLQLDRYEIEVEFARTFPASILQRWCILPFDRMSKSVFVATANPFNKQAQQELEEAAKQRFIWYLVPPPDLIKALRKVIRQS